MLVQTYQRYGGIIEDGLSALVDQIRRTRETDCGDLAALAVASRQGRDVGLDGQRSSSQIPTKPRQRVQCLDMNGQLVDLDVIGGIFRVRPPQDRIGRGVKNVLGVRASEVGCKGHIERAVNRGIGGVR